MNKTETANQLRLAAELIETGHPWECRVENDRWIKNMENDCPLPALAFKREIRPILATPPDGRPLHNPDNLTAEQVGLGWRLTLANEDPHPLAEVHVNPSWKRRDEADLEKPYGCWHPRDTYRLPLSVPWPEASQPQPPFQLPPPPPGMMWHREDGWKEGDLPQGYRPLVYNECRKNEDEWTYGDGNGWRLVANYGPEGEVGKGAARHRTTRPLVFTHEGKEWTYHRPGDPMPCDEDARIDIVCDTGKSTTDDGDPLIPRIASHNIWDKTIGWRYAETTKQVELGPEDVPPGSVILAATSGCTGTQWVNVTSAKKDGVEILGRACVPWSELRTRWKINRSIPLTGKWDANAWEPCSKEVKA